MSVYENNLSNAFPVVLRIDSQEEANRYITQLIQPMTLEGELFPCGSSFAYTADGPYLWLSAVSARRLGMDYRDDAFGRVGPGYGQDKARRQMEHERNGGEAFASS